MIRVLNVLLLVLFIGLMVVNWLVTPNFSKVNPDPIIDMAKSGRYNSFSANENFKTAGISGGMTLQDPASGAIVFGHLPLHFGISTEAAQLAGEVLKNPMNASDPAALERGATVFTTFCFPCHGTMARGDGPVTTRGFPPPPSIVTGKYLSYKDGQIFHVITYGMNNMPAYSRQILSDDRWRAILYVRTLQKKAVQEEEAKKLAALKQKQGQASGPLTLDTASSTIGAIEPVSGSSSVDLVLPLEKPQVGSRTVADIPPASSPIPASGGQEP